MKQLATIALLLLATLGVHAGPLTEARVNKIINDVVIVDDSSTTRPAQLNDIVKDAVGVKTGIKSRSELLFQDNTLTRLGPESYFSFKAGTRDMALKEGTMLLQVPKGLGGAKIRTAAVTAAITGTTIMLEHIPGKHIKVLVLEGSMRLSVNGRFGDSLLLLPGKMVIMRPDANRIPDPVTVDLAKVVKTSSLVKMPKADGSAAPGAILPSMPLIQHEIDLQAKAKNGDSLVDTNLVILGGGTNVLMAPDDVLKTIDKKESIDGFIVASNPPAPGNANGGGNGNGNNSGNGNGGGLGNGGPAPTPAATPVAVATPAATATPAPASTATPTPASSATPTPASTATPTPSSSATPTPAATATPTPAATATPTPAASATPQPSATPTPAASATPQPSATPAPTATPVPSATPAPTASPEPSATPTPAPTATPEPSATPTPAPTATPEPSATPTPAPTATPEPSATPTPAPSATPTPAATPLPSATPIATPVAASSPLPTPNMTAGPSQSPATRVNAPPPLHGAIKIDAATAINLRATPPRISAGAGYNGSIYQGAAADGPASWFALGNSSAYDGQRHFDARFGMNYDQAFPAAGVAVFRFASVALDGMPVINTNGAVHDVVLVGNAGISSSSGATSFAWNLDNLKSLTLATTNGPLSIDAPQFVTTAGSQFEFLQLYQRGADGAVKLSNLNMPTASLYVDSTGRISLGGSDVVTADRIVLHTDKNIDIVGAIGANFLQLYAGTSIDFKKKISPAQILYGYSNLFISAQDLIVTGGALDIGSGGINMSGIYVLQGFDNITTSGNVLSGDISVANQLFIGGDLTTKQLQLSISAFSAQLPKGITYNGAAADVGTTLNLDVQKLTIGSGGIAGVNLDGGSGVLAGLAGGDGGTLNIGTLVRPVAHDVTIDQAVSATTGANAAKFATGGSGGSVNVVSNATVAVNSTIKVSDSAAGRKSSRGGNINVTSNKTAGTAIAVSSSAQLLSLLDNAAPGQGGSIRFTSAGGAVNVKGAVRADRGTIDFKNNGDSGVINIENATMHANTVKVAAFGPDGQLNVGGGTISADSTINLYAGGSNGQVNFTDNVTLSGNSVKTIQGNTVTINDGKVVTVNGTAPANVFTNNPNYSGSGGNGSTTGTFGGQGATTAPLSAGPGPGG
jgi:hypothetical protein